MSSKAPAHPEQNEPARAGESQSAASPEESGRRKFGPMTPGSVISFLYNRVQEDMDRDELKFLSEASGCASFMAYNLEKSVSNIGCLINDDYTPGSMRAGNFEIPDSVSSLLFVIADHLKVISELTQIGSDASATLIYKERGHV
jgi:hypothetical protein